jgi:serine protease Do
VAIPDPKQLQRVVSGLPVGREAPVTLLRDGREITVAVRVARLPDKQDITESGAADAAPVVHNKAAIQGMTLVATNGLRHDATYKPKGQGVMVLDVEPESPAAEVGIDPGDVLVEIDRKPVVRVQDVVSQLGAAASKGRKALVLLVDHDGARHFTAIAPH